MAILLPRHGVNLSRLARTIADRDDELRSLLQGAESVTGLLAERRGEGLAQRMLDALWRRPARGGWRGCRWKPARRTALPRRGRCMRGPASPNAGRSRVMARTRTASS